MTEQPLRNHQTQDHGDGEDCQVSGGRHIHELQDRDAHRPHHTKHHGQGAADDRVWNQREDRTKFPDDATEKENHPCDLEHPSAGNLHQIHCLLSSLGLIHHAMGIRSGCLSTNTCIKGFTKDDKCPRLSWFILTLVIPMAPMLPLYEVVG